MFSAIEIRVLTVAEEDLALASRSVWVCIGIGLSEIVAGFDVNKRAFLHITQVVIGTRAERQDMVPCCSWFSAS